MLSKPVRFHGTLTAAFWIALALHGPDARAQGTTLRGVVVDALTHEPIARVLVDSPVGGASVLTDNAGRFSFADVPVGSTHLSYRRPGYFDTVNGQQAASRLVLVTAGMPDPVLPLEAAAALRGQLQLPEGDSAAGLRVDLYQSQVTDGHRHWRLLQTVRAHGDGAFSFDALRAGSYLVHAQASLDPSPVPAQPRTRFGYAPVFAPDTADPGAATVFALLPGQVAEARLRLARVPFYPVAIRIAGADGDGGGRGFQITGNGFTNWTPRFDRDNDSLMTELPNGNYTLRAAGGGRQPAAGDLPFHVDGAPVAGLSITVNPSAAMPVAVDTVTDGASQGQTPRLGSFSLVPVNPMEGQVSSIALESDEATGQTLLRRGLAPGQYWVFPVVSGGYAASLTSGGVDLLSQPLNVTAGSTPSLHATLRADAGSLSVSRAGALLTDAGTIQVVPLSPGGAARASAGNGDPGTPVVFAGLPPGDYLVLATAGQDSIAYREAGVVAQLKGERVTVAAGAAAQATLSTMVRLPPFAVGAP